MRSAGEGAHAHAGEGRVLKFFYHGNLFIACSGPCSCDYRAMLDVYDMIGIKYVPWRSMSGEIRWREGVGEGEGEGAAGYFWITVIYL